jgi:replicative DNA helicase
MSDPRVPPYSKEAEETVLGSILLNNGVVEVIKSILSPDDFYMEGHRRIYGAMLSLLESGVPIDSVTMGNRLIQSGDLEKIGGAMALGSLTDHVATVTNAGHYAEIVRKKAVLRRVIHAANMMIADVFADDGDEGEIERDFVRMQGAVESMRQRRMPVSIPDQGDVVMQLYERTARGIGGVPLPWPHINAMTNGMHPKTLTMFAARPGTGKCQKFDTPICCSRTGRYMEIQRIVEEKCDVFSRDEGGGIVAVTPDAWLHTGKKKCLKVRLSSGREMSQTPEHPFMTVDGWARTDALVVGDSVEVAGSIPAPTEAIFVTRQEAVLLGGMLADGGVTHHCSFTKSDDVIVAMMRDAVGHFGGELVHRDGEPACQHHAIRPGGHGGIGPNPIREVLQGLGCKMVLSKEKEIPNRVFQYDNDSLAIFLGMLWSCDGSFPIRGDQLTVEIGLASKTMVVQLQRLFLRFGIHGRVRYKRVKLHGDVFDSWVYGVYAASFGAFRDLIPIYGEKSKRAALLRDSTNPNVDNIPMSRALAARIKDFVGAIPPRERARRYRVMEARLGMTTPFSASHLYRRRTVSRRTFAAFVDAFGCDELRPLLANHWDMVVEISDDGEQDVYDLTVNGTHSFIANDVVVHNTFLAVIGARHAWLEGFRVLVVSPEMAREEIAERFFAVHAGVSYLHMVNGTMSDYEMPKLQQSILESKGREGLRIMDSDDDLTPAGIEAAMQIFRPQLVAIDSMYDLRVRGERRDKLLIALEWFKGVLRRFDMAGLGFVQLNRAAEVSEKKGGGIRLGTIALGDEVGQDPHAVFALEQDKDMFLDRQMRIKPLKLRRGSRGKFSEGVKVWWDFDAMRFSEVEGQEEDAAYEDDVPF